ncbi:TPA: phage tail protein [Yersinia enterocolitica]|uniref:phage tail-collar fiber domain-containing protein n=1 Tax=Yersinia enterocolitica TaxID=630 RepID=UPI0005E0CA6B|nr:phage tail protein [Yersinia enterocolitica]CFW61914.1 tail fiber repeat 2-containing protein [Yersinia enterocolitica]CND20767.1 tail fiber repeat 2-containing protein [Yersinia enterocolitica]CNE86394.1 tail fiber repeat 2-containing protein [Yersinia enterocolitica]CNH47077.1 tail fiber repeat 2-containing protein [Yersinia enterocolitica]CNH64650.1 tail fiber repeat 2-containing protein [Yersinia enterocolitica]
MATVITRAFEHWQAGQVLNNLPARPDTIIFAHVPGLDHTAEINPDEGIPADGQIVHRDVVAQYGLINDSAVAYSVVLDTRVGDFTFNWIGLVDAASNTLCMIVHTPAQQKIATANGVQGNNITRTFLMEFAGAAEASQITVSAQTWQIDFSARLRGIDEVSRLANLDYYGHAAFFADGFSVSKDGDKYRVKAGLAYVGGIRALLADDVLLEAVTGNVVYADVSYQGSVLSEFAPIIHLGVKHSAGDFGDYTDANGFTHYIASLALITASGEEDKREANPFDKAIADINAALKEHEKSRNHPDATLNDKGFTQLSSAVDSDSEALAATLKAVKITMENANARLAKERNGADIPNVALFRQNIGVKGAASLEVGTTAGTVAAGDDSRIVDAISSKNTNIQLPGALTAGSDIRAGRLLSKGDLVAGEGRAQGHATFGVDGNIYGTLWGGYLSTYLSNRTDHRVRAWAAVQGNGTIISSFGFAAINRTNVGGYNFTMSTSNGAYAVTVGIGGGSQNGALSAHSANIWNRTPNSFSIQNTNDGGTSYDWRDWPEFYVIVVGP